VLTVTPVTKAINDWGPIAFHHFSHLLCIVSQTKKYHYFGKQHSLALNLLVSIHNADKHSNEEDSPHNNCLKIEVDAPG
jgi:hypothetical protein